MAKDTTKKTDVEREAQELLGRVPEWISLMPEGAREGFWLQFRDFELSDTVLPSKVKDLIGLAVAGATRCRYCALFHTEGAKLHGATDDEIAEACAIGGLTMQASTFLNAMQVDYEEFRSETEEIVKYVKSKMAEKEEAKEKESAEVAAHA